MKKRILIVLAATALLLAGTYAAFARGLMFGFGPHLYSNLSKEQAEKLWQIREKFRNETESLRKEIFLKRLELRQLYSDPNATEEQIRSKQKELISLQERLSEKISEQRIEERKILTPDQLKRMGEIPMGAPGYGLFCKCK